MKKKQNSTKTSKNVNEIKQTNTKTNFWLFMLLLFLAVLLGVLTFCILFFAKISIFHFTKLPKSIAKSSLVLERYTVGEYNFLKPRLTKSFPWFEFFDKLTIDDVRRLRTFLGRYSKIPHALRTVAEFDRR